MLSVPVITEAVVDLQVQTLEHAKRAIEVGADMIVAQGAEAGGHGAHRATMTLVPEVADWIGQTAPDRLLVAAGGVGDGRGVAAALMLGADGVLVGSRLWASDEALVHQNMLDDAVRATGDTTVRTSVADVARKLDWPEQYTCRVLQNQFVNQWHADLPGLIAKADSEAAKWADAWAAGDTTVVSPVVGEVVGIINRVEPAAVIIATMVAESERLLGGGWRKPEQLPDS